MKHRHAYAKLYYHAVVATRHRAPLIAGEEQETELRTLVIAKCQELDAYVHGFGAWTDHMHVVFSARPALAIGKWVHDVKGSTSWTWNRNRIEAWGPLAWQDGYWVETISPRDMPALREYARQQRQHHAAQTLNPAWEPPADTRSYLAAPLVGAVPRRE